MTRALKYSIPQRRNAYKKAVEARNAGRITKEQFDKRVQNLNNKEKDFRKKEKEQREEERMLEIAEAQFLRDLEEEKRKKEKEKREEERRKKKEALQKERQKKLIDLYRRFIQQKDTFNLSLSQNRSIGISDAMTISQLTSIIPAGQKWVLKIGTRFYVLNDTTRANLLRHIQEDSIVVNQSQMDTSDGAFMADVSNADTITVSPLKPKAQRNRASQGFFRYNNLTHFDLTRYGIYNNNDPLNYNDTCLVHALRMGGCSEEKLSQVKLCVKNRLIPRSDLPKICDLVKIQIKLRTEDTKNDYRLIYGKEHEEKYHIGVLEDHAFIIEPTNITSYCITNYNEVKNERDCNLIIKKKAGKYYERDAKRCLDSFNLIRTMLENKDHLLKEITMEDQLIASTQFYSQVKEEIVNLEYNDEKCCRAIGEMKEKENKFKNVFFDFETDPNGVHKPYLCRTFDGRNHREFIGEDCGLKMLFSLTENTRLIAHNCTYDFRFIVQYLTRIDELARGNRLISAKGRFRDLDIEIKDSFHLISMPLRAFPKVFGIRNTIKEVMPYTLYNQDNIAKRFVPIADAIAILPEDEHQQFKDNIVRWSCAGDNDTYDIIKYSSEYCKIDCEILYSGYIQFRSWIKTAFNLDIDVILTCASLAHRYFISKGCYEGVYELGGIPQMFIQGCVVGGRVMCAENKKIIVNDIVNDFDAVSLYPSAMSRMDGFLKGKPKVIQNLSYDWLKKQDGYFVDIRITGVGIHRKFPLMSYKNDEGVRIFSNEMVGRIIRCDKTSLEDFITYHNITFDIVKGYYFDEGYNTKVRDVIKYIFNKRLEEKKNKNPVEMVYKLIMNSGYGKSIMKPVETESRFFDTYNGEDEFLTYLDRNYNWITSYVRFGSKVKVNLVKTLVEHFNIAQVGVTILSQSKRIMNEVMCLAEDIGVDLYYQDTDSMHLKDSDIAILSDAFKAKYNRELIGKSLGQFHSDFSLDGCSNIVAVKSIFLGKKCYIDKLQGINADGEVEYGFHIRMKGIPEKCIDYVVQNTDKYNDPVDLYMDLYNGNKVVFDLTNGGTKANFKFNKDYTIETLSMFSRSVSF